MCLANTIVALFGMVIIDWEDLVTLSIWTATKAQAIRQYLDLYTTVLISTAMIPYEIMRELQNA